MSRVPGVEFSARPRSIRDQLLLDHIERLSMRGASLADVREGIVELMVNRLADPENPSPLLDAPLECWDDLWADMWTGLRQCAVLAHLSRLVHDVALDPQGHECETR